MGLANEISCEAGSFSCCHLNPHRCFQSEAFRLYFPTVKPWVVQSVLLPRCSSQFICAQMWYRPARQPRPCYESSPPGCPSLPLLWVWINVSSLTPWLSDFHSARFSVSSDCFLFLNLLLSFFWLCKKAQCVYLHLHLDQKGNKVFFN